MGDLVLMRPSILLATAGVLLGAGVPSWGASREAYEKVREGIAQYESADYAAAAQSFGEALSASPHELRIVFNQACSARARGELEQAVELFQKASVSEDRQVATPCRYNLGVIAAERARQVFGEHPEQAEGETRKEGLEHLDRAIAYYRDCLSVDPDHEQARHNLEVIRLWIKHMEVVWRERDRQKARDEMDLMTFLRYIDLQQRGLRGTNRSLARLPDSPKRRHAVRITGTSQRELTEEIAPLKQKIEAMVDKAFAAATQSSTGTPEEQQQRRDAKLKPLLELADVVGRHMSTAARRLTHQEVPEAGQSQTAAVEKLDELFMELTDFPQLLKRAIEEQQTLIDRVAPAAAAPDGEYPLDTPDTAWRQRFVEDWARMLIIQARSTLPQVERLLSSAPATADNGPSAQDPPSPVPPDPQRQQLTGLKQSMEKAVELAPRVVKLASAAAARLDANQPAEALPPQEEALELLREIAKPLQQEPPPERDREENKQNPNEQEPEKQDNPDQQPQNEQEDEGQQKQPQQQPQEADQQQKQTGQQQLQAMLDKIRERNRKQDERRKMIRAALGGRVNVDKDW
jgi:hypothetical protein